MFSRPVPPSAPASQKHTFGQEIAGKRARKDGLAGGHYGFFRLFGLVSLEVGCDTTFPPDPGGDRAQGL